VRAGRAAKVGDPGRGIDQNRHALRAKLSSRIRPRSTPQPSDEALQETHHTSSWTAPALRRRLACPEPTIPAMLRTLCGHGHKVGAVAWSPDGTRLASASGDGTVRVWDPAEHTELTPDIAPEWPIRPQGPVLRPTSPLRSLPEGPQWVMNADLRRNGRSRRHTIEPIWSSAGAWQRDFCGESVVSSPHSSERDPLPNAKTAP